MCGHVGVFGQGILSSDIEAYKDLLFMDQMRGHHATGMADIKRFGSCNVIKKALPAVSFLEEADVKTALFSANLSVAVMGHNRWATQGGLTDANAHPFNHGHITLAHNGSLTSRYGLSGSLTDFEVDSNHIAYTMHLKEPLEVLPNIQGPYALVWHDARDQSLNFARNSQRPMYIVKLKGREVYFYGSELALIYAAINRRKTVPEVESIEELPIHVHRKYLLPNTTVFTTRQMEDVKYTQVYPTYAGSSYNYYGSNSFKPRVKFKGNKQVATTDNTTVSEYDRQQYAKLGVTRGDVVEVDFYEYIPYTNSNNANDYGRMFGYTAEGVDVVVYNVTGKLASDCIQHNSRDLGAITLSVSKYSSIVIDSDNVNRASEGTPWIVGNGATIEIPTNSYGQLNLDDLPTLEDEEMDTLFQGNVVEMKPAKKSGNIDVGGHMIDSATWMSNSSRGCADCKKTLYRTETLNYLYDPTSKLIYCETCK